jgi:RNA polymerase sigma-70 factor (ECF subfamily)
MTVTETELIINAQQGNIEAFESLIYKYDKNVLSLALKYVKNSDDAKDIYQEVFLRVFKGLKKFQFKSEFSTWLFRITTNVCLTHSSKTRKKKFVSINEENNDNESSNEILQLPDEDNDTPDKLAEKSEIKNIVDNALESLSPKQKMIFTLKHYEGYKIREIAEIMECGEGTVKKTLFEAVHKMRNQLQNYYR